MWEQCAGGELRGILTDEVLVEGLAFLRGEVVVARFGGVLGVGYAQSVWSVLREESNASRVDGLHVDAVRHVPRDEHAERVGGVIPLG